MVSKIDSPSPSPLRRIESLTSEPHQAPAPISPPARNTASAQVGKSLLERASSEADNSPHVDVARVNDIKAAIAQGEFKIDPNAVARAFLKMESE